MDNVEAVRDLGTLSSNGVAPSNAPIKGSETAEEESVGMGNIKETGPSRCNRTVTHINTWRLCQHV